MPLGSSPGPFDIVLDSLAPRNLRTEQLFKVFTDAAFRHFEALAGPLGLILAPRGPIWSQSGLPKLLQKLSQKCPETGPENDPEYYFKTDQF